MVFSVIPGIYAQVYPDWTCGVPTPNCGGTLQHLRIFEPLTKGSRSNPPTNCTLRRPEGRVVNMNWVLLDSQSTANQVANLGMLINIRMAKNMVTIH